MCKSVEKTQFDPGYETEILAQNFSKDMLCRYVSRTDKKNIFF